jgi:predicted unusual protein kinase regulating ubiquinone biosynthesis (AarF/ABC1/UbiB family)
LLAELSTYAYPEAYPPLSWNPSRHKDNHYNWFYDLANANQKASGTMLLILTNQPAESEIAMLKASFEDVLQIQAPALSAINIGGTSRNAYAFEVRNFRGYP